MKHVTEMKDVLVSESEITLENSLIDVENVVLIESAKKKVKPQIEIKDLEDKTTIDEEIDREKRLL